MKESFKQSQADPKVYLTKIIGGKVFSIVVGKAEAEKSLLQKPGYSLIEEGEELGRVKMIVTVQCPSCGCSKEGFEKTGRLGCPDCYQAFAPFLMGMIGKMHIGLRHSGKVPPGRMTPAVIKARMEALSIELDKAVGIEKYEEAARLRDEIRAMAGSLESPQ